MSNEYYQQIQYMSDDEKKKQLNKHLYILEKRKCEDDYLYFIENFIYTFDPRTEEKYMKFKLYDFQKDYIKQLHEAVENKHDLIVDKSRDMGFSWLVISYMFWRWNFKTGFQCLFGSKKEENVDSIGKPDTIFGKFDIILKKLPNYLKPKGFDLNKHRNFMKLINPERGGVISGESSNQDFARSGRYDCIVMDEFAFWDNDERAWTATGDSSPCRILGSTPNGLGNTFANIRFSGNTKHFEMHWRLHPSKGQDCWFDDEQQIWRSPWYDKEVQRRLTADDSSIKNLKQELDIHYIQSGDPVFTNFKLHQLNEQHPDEEDDYAMGVDVSQGLEGGDNQSITVISKKTGKQAHQWTGKLDIYELAEKILRIGFQYNTALIGVERNNGGQEVINLLKKRYKRLYYEKRYEGRTDAYTSKLGIYTHLNKESMVLDLQASLISGECKITDKETYDELLIYQIKKSDRSNNYKYEAPKGKHDDRVMSLVIAWRVLKDVKPPLTKLEKLIKKDKKRKIKSTKRFISRTCGY